MTIPAPSPNGERKVVSRPLTTLHCNEQVRKDFDPLNLQTLANSLRIKQHQPLLVCLHPTLPDPHRLVIEGERRLRAAPLAGLTHLDCLDIEKPASKLALKAMQVTVNVVREGMNPVELSTALWEMKKEGKLTEMQLAEMIGVPQPTINNWMKPRHLAPDLLHHVENYDVCASVARIIASIRNLDEQRKIMQEAIERKLTRDQVQVLVDERKNKNEKKPPAIKGRTPSGSNFFYQSKRRMTGQEIFEDLKAILAIFRKNINLPPEAWGHLFNGNS